MASKQESPKSEASEAATKRDDFFGGEETVAADLPRYAIGDPTKAKPDGTPILATIDCYYEETQQQVIEGKTRLSHRVRPHRPIEGHKRIILWGNSQIDAVLPCLEPGSKVRLTYMGTRPLRGGKTLKEIEILTAASTKRTTNPYLASLAATSDEIE